MNTQVRYGLIAGLLMANWPFVAFYAGLSITEQAILVLGVPYLILLLFLIMAILRHRKEAGWLDLREGMRTGLGVSGLAALLYSLARYIFISKVSNLEAQSKREQLHDVLVGQGMGESKIKDEAASYMATYAFHNLLTTIAFTLMVGGIMSIIISLILRKQQQQAV